MRQSGSEGLPERKVWGVGEASGLKDRSNKKQALDSDLGLNSNFAIHLLWDLSVSVSYHYDDAA